MIITIKQRIDCKDIEIETCSENILTALGHDETLKLKAEHPTDSVHGSVTVIHHDLPDEHIIAIELYEKTEQPTAATIHGEIVGRESTLQACETMPTITEFQKRLKTFFPVD